MTNKFFFWKPGVQVFTYLPIRVIKGSDEHGWHTIGIVTWIGSIFYRYEKCTCPDVMKQYGDMLEQNNIQKEES